MYHGLPSEDKRNDETTLYPISTNVWPFIALCISCDNVLPICAQLLWERVPNFPL